MLQHRGPTPPKLGPEARSLAPKWKPKGPNVAPIWFPKPFKIYPKPPKIRHGPMGYPPLASPRTAKKTPTQQKGGWIYLGPPIFSEKVASMAPSWVPKWSQDGRKIDAKINHFFDASWDRFLDGFWWILGAKMEASWHQNWIRKRYHL